VDDKEENIAISYDCDTGVCHVRLLKSFQGEHFEGLDMITSLMAVPKIRASNNTSLIQELDDNDREQHHHDNHVTEGVNQEEGDQKDDELEWFFEGTMPSFTEESTSRQHILGEKYGFANGKDNVFNRLGDEVVLAIDLKDPDVKPPSVRRRERIQQENEKFDEDYYLSCLFEQQDQVKNMLEFKPFWMEEQEDLTDNDLYDMKNLSNKKYLLDRQEKKQVLLSLIDILFGFTYDVRVNEGEDCSESNWNICKLSSTLSWLETYSNITDVVESCLRRSIIYPLVRHYDISLKCLQDVLTILRKGRKTVLRCLLMIRRILVKTIDSKYILNDIYINDYCVWIQRMDNSTLIKVADSLEKAMSQVNKGSLGLDLELLEGAAKLCLEEK